MTDKERNEMQQQARNAAAEYSFIDNYNNTTSPVVEVIKVVSQTVIVGMKV